MGWSADELRGIIADAASAVGSLAGHAERIAEIASLLGDRLERGGAVYTCGNGGSAAQALHLAEEMIGRYEMDRPPMRAVCLNADPAALTCIANDFGYDAVFERQALGLMTDRDVLVALSTSGNSPNVVRGLRAARSAGGATVGLLGKTGGEAAALCDLALVLPLGRTDRIQEAHQVVIHLLLGSLESDLPAG